MSHIPNYVKDERKVVFFASFVELAERYSFYVIQALLIFYLIKEFNLTNNTAESMIGTTLSLLYISSIIGGLIADKMLGYYRAAFVGAVVLLVGLLTISIFHKLFYLYLGLSCISISTGLIKSNISSLLGKFYNKSQLSNGHRDYGFNIFYVGINLGGFIALFFASMLKDKFGYSAPFYSNLIVIAIMFLILITGYYKLKVYVVDNLVTLKQYLIALSIIALCVLLGTIVLLNSALANYVVVVSVVCCIFILIKSMDKNNYPKICAITLFFCLSIVYWSLYFQIFSSILVFIDAFVSKNIWAVNLYTSQFLSIESISVILFGALVGKTWLTLEKNNINVSAISKFSIGLFVMSLSFFILSLSINFSIGSALISPLHLFIFFTLLAISELCLSAVGISFITKNAPRGYVSLYMGIWLVTLGVGGKLSGYLAAVAKLDPKNILSSKLSMTHALILYSFIALCGALVGVLLRKKVNNTIHTMI